MADARPTGRAELTTRRTLLFAVGASVAISSVAALAVADPGGRVALPAWQPALTTAAFAVTLAAGLAAPWLPARVLRAGAGVAVALFVSALVTLVPASGMLSGRPSVGTIPWALTSIGGITLAALVAGGSVLAWSVLGLWTAVVAVSRIALDGYTLTGVANDSQALLTAATLALIGAGALRASARLDAASSRTEAAVAREAAERGRLVARARAAAFVHDEVLAALRGAADAVAGSAAAVRAQAERATGMVRDRPPPADWVGQLRALAEGAREPVAFELTRSADGAQPGEVVVEALLTAAGQAIENSLRHAGPCRRVVRVRVETDGVRVEVRDDGRGFDPAAVRADRLGIATSIVGVVRETPGATVRIDSAPGAGTAVALAWRAESASSAAPARAARVTMRVGMRAIGALFIVTQSIVAVVAAVQAPFWPTPVLELAGLLLAAEILRRAPARTVTRVRSAVVVALLAAVAAAGLAATPAPITYGTAWFVPAAGFVLVALALRGRAGHALAGLAALLALLALTVAVRDVLPVHAVSLGARTLTVVGLGALLAVLLVRLRRSTLAQADRAVLAARRAAWDAAVQDELDARAVDVDRYARPLLERVARGEELGEDERAQARAVDGRLRDGYRAGRLLAGAVPEAAMAARLRGVDVLLLDDRGEDGVDDPDLAALAGWLRTHLDAAQGRFVGRLLPVGREHLAQALVDGRIALYPAAESVSSVQGE